MKVPILTANHPSYIFNADDKLKDDPNTPQDERLPTLMCDDLIAAAWQVEMGKDPTQDPQTVLNACQAKWREARREGEVCVLTCMQALNMTEHEATSQCAQQNPRVAEFFRDESRYAQRVNNLTERIGSLDSRSKTAILIQRIS
jgi:hypothetical protein